MGFLETSQQFSTFDLVKGILKSNSVLSKRFKDKDYEEFFPNLASLSLSNLPLIVIEITNSSDPENITTNHKLKLRSFEIPITLINSYEARSKVKDYVNAIVDAIEGAEDTFEASNYYDPQITFNGTDLGLIQGKTAIRSEFVLTLSAHTQR